MKSLISTLIIFAITTSTFAGVREDVQRLGHLAMGSDVFSIKSKNAEELFKKFIEKEHGEFDLDYYENKEIDDMSFGDEVDFGFTSVQSAKTMGGFAESQLNELLENSDDETDEIRAKISNLNKNWSPLIQKLHNQGVKFGYDGFGPGYCGVSFIRMILVDEQGQKIYVVYLSNSGEC